ncbi:MAG: hypothetical protein C4554_03025 [Dethiobacter sp.]|jgi:transposase-like protein|nr:MAG: hypothetical protein C4554_03025 [Dethiobacter sp.]
MSCPVCKSINTGKVGHNAYYCADCLLEFTENDGEIAIYYIDAEGSSYALRDKDAAAILVKSIREGNDLLLQESIEELIIKS